VRATAEGIRDAASGGQRRLPGRGVLLLVLAVSFGVFAGVGTYTFGYAKGFSYFSTDPSACVNCHIMRSQFDAWQKSSHHAVARCVDCHLPQDFAPKYFAKAENGFRHAAKFTLDDFVEPIEVQQRGREILQENCIRCHEPLVAEIVRENAHATEPRCVRCHFAVGHGDVARLGGPRRASEE
jgi:cytochrome c nitrite reductase small subunit